jgi:hypothetical protein
MFPRGCPLKVQRTAEFIGSVESSGQSKHAPVTMLCVGVGQKTDACHRWHACQLLAVHGEAEEPYGGCMVHRTLRCRSLNSRREFLK